MILSDIDLKRMIEANHLEIKPLAKDTIQQNGIDLKMNDELAIGTQADDSGTIDGTSSEDIKKFFRIVKSNEGYFQLVPLKNYLLTTEERLEYQTI